MRAPGSDQNKPVARHARASSPTIERASAGGSANASATTPGNSQILRALSGGDPLLRDQLVRDMAGIARDEGLGENSSRLGQMDEDVDVAPGGGQPLPDAVRERMEKAFGHDFSHVRIHVDARAAKAADSLNAHAYALGSDLYFNSGEFAPGTPAGDRLLAHELTHVVQHDEGKLASDGGVSSPTDPSEQEAYGNEGRILSALSADASAPDASAEAGPSAPTTSTATTTATGAAPVSEPSEAAGTPAESEAAMRSQASEAAEGATPSAETEADHDDPLKKLKDRASDPFKIDELAGRVGDPKKLVSLMDRVDDADHLATMLDQVPDTEALGSLLEQVADPERLAPLMGELAGGDALPALLDEVGVDELVGLVDKLPDDAPDDLLEHVDDAAELVGLLDAVEGEEEISAILDETDDPAAVVDRLRAKRDGTEAPAGEAPAAGAAPASPATAGPSAPRGRSPAARGA